MRRPLALAALLVVCAAAVLVYQSTRPQASGADARVFVPSPRFYLDLSPSFRTSIADAYWLQTIQYYGEHLRSDGRFDSLWPMLDLVTTLSPRFKQAYFTGAFALIDAARPDLSYGLLRRGFEANPADWHFPAYLGFFAYRFANNKDKDRIAARWYAKAAALPGRPAYIPRLAAALLTRSGARDKAIAMWSGVYAEGDKYSREKAVKALSRLLATDPQQRAKELASVQTMMSPEVFFQLLEDLGVGSV